MKRLAKIASLILAVAVMAATFVLIPANEHLHVHAESTKVYNGTKYSLEMDTSSAIQGQFSLVYAYDDLASLWGSTPSYPTASGDVLKVGDRTLFSVHTDGYIHLDLPATYGTGGYFAGVVFTAPSSGVYTFSIEASLYKPAGGWTGSADKWNNNYVYATAYEDTEATTDAATFPVLNQPLVNGVNMVQTPLSITKTVTLKEGEKIAWAPVCGMDGTVDMIKKFDVTLDKIVYDLKMDTSSATQGQFTFNYAAGDIVNAFADNANHPTADNGVLKVGDRELFTVASDGYIHANIPDSASEYYTAIVFSAPVTGTYTFNMNVGLYKPGSGWIAESGNWNNHYVYAAGYDVDSDASTNVGATDNWPVRNQTLYDAGNGRGTLEVIVNKTITMNKGDKIAWLPICGANGAYDLIRSFTVTLEEVNCTNHVWNGDNVCDDCGYTCTYHAWNGDNVCDTCGTTCTDHDYDAEFKCKTCGTSCPHTTKTTGNCQTDITCEACGKTFGKNDSVHAGQPQWINTDTPAATHKKVYSCCPTVVVVVEAEHNWDEDTCIDCTYECQHPSWDANGCTVCEATCNHTGGTATCTSKKECDNCGQPYGNLDLTNHTGEIKYSNGDENGHTATYKCCDTVVPDDTEHVWVDGICDKCDYECVHTGGTNTCVSKKECEECGEEYGDLAGTHDFENDYSKNDTHHWYDCTEKANGCDEKDQYAEHDFSNGDCVCGAKKPAPPTGDNGIAFAVALITLCGAGIAFASKKRSGR